MHRQKKAATCSLCGESIEGMDNEYLVSPEGPHITCVLEQRTAPPSKPAMKKAVACQSCGEEVEVKFVSYGGGHIAICPKCGCLAYNGE